MIQGKIIKSGAVQLMKHLDEITDRVVREAIHNDASEVAIRQQLLDVED